MVLADSVILPFNVTHYGVNMKIFSTQIKTKFEDDFKSYSASEELSKLLFSFSTTSKHSRIALGNFL